MKLSEAWLREWVNPELNGEELAAQLTMIGLEVDARHPVAGEFTGVVVAEVTETRPHPQADKLTLCEVSTGGAIHQIVCGARNVRSGLKVALATLGAKLPCGLIIKKAKLRGELSQGMLCSAAELGLEDSSEGIMELAADAPVGKDLRDYLQLDDAMLEIALTPNRADCFSIMGIAREVAAINDLSLNKPAITKQEPETEHTVVVEVETENACPKYCGRVINGLNPNALTPLWMKERLRRSGIRCLHPVVDTLNYVMLELGQPMHAFDLAALQGGIQVRYSKPEESLLLLNDQKVSLQKRTLMIADGKKPLAIAGVMGGEESAVKIDTKDIFIESAYFNPKTIAGVARSYGLCTDSSQRFERGVDPELQRNALERASELILSIAGGSCGPIVQSSAKEALPQAKTISFHPQKVAQLCGINIAADEMASTLQRLGMEVMRQETPWSVAVPSFRFDVQLEVDLVEEIVRIHGYDQIEAHALQGEIKGGQINPSERLASEMGAFFINRGYRETISYSFVDPELQQALYSKAEKLNLLNPISQELSVMRTGMWPGLIASMLYNIHRQHSAVRFFETGVVFSRDNQQIKERRCIAGLLAGEYGGLNWSEMTRQFDFFDMKGDLQALFSSLHLNKIEFLPATHAALHPGKCARILIGGQPIGWLGVMHPKLSDALDLTYEVMLFELDIQSLPALPKQHYHSISKYPSIRRDLSFLVKQTVTVADIEHSVRAVIPEYLFKGFAVFDVYTGAGVPKGQKSLALAITVQDEQRTLIDAEINAIIDAIIKKLKEDFSIELRE